MAKYIIIGSAIIIWGIYALINKRIIDKDIKKFNEENKKNEEENKTEQ